MKKIVIFYSLEGNTTFVAKAISEAIDADILELKPKKDLNPKSFLRFFPFIITQNYRVFFNFC